MVKGMTETGTVYMVRGFTTTGVEYYATDRDSGYPYATSHISMAETTDSLATAMEWRDEVRHESYASMLNPNIYAASVMLTLVDTTEYENTTAKMYDLVSGLADDERAALLRTLSNE